MAKRSKKKRTVEGGASAKVAAAPIASGHNFEWPWWLSALAILAATVLVYTPALGGAFLWDDNTCISENDCLRTWRGLGQIWFQFGATEQYYPLTFSVWWLEYHLWGLHTLGYHLVNVLLHGVAAVLLWRVLAALRMRGALLAGAIFALHPVNVMSVAWMTELKNTLSGSLALGAGWAYVRFAGLGIYEKAGLAGKPEWRWYVLALALFQLAMLAKTAVSFLPVTLLLILWWQRKHVRVRDVGWLIPMAAISVGMGLMTIYVEQHFGRAFGADFQLGFWERMLVSGRSFWFYLGKLLFPYPLTFIYERWTIDTGAWWQYLYPLAMLGLLAGLWLARGRVGKGVWVAFMHFYLTTSMLVLIVVLYMMRYSFVSDHWQYFGSMGMIGLLAAAITAGLARFGLEGKPWGVVLKLGLLLVLGMMSWQRSWVYENLETLWIDTLDKNPNCWLANNNLGVEFLQTGRVDESMPKFQKAMDINPRYAEAYNNMGMALFNKGQMDEAMAEFQKAVDINPRYDDAHNGIGMVLFKQGKLDEAMVEFQKALEINPESPRAASNLGAAFFQKGRMDDAIALFQSSLEINPEIESTHFDLGRALMAEGRVDEAITEYRRALELSPDYVKAHNFLGEALLKKGEVAEAVFQFQEALHLDPEYRKAQDNLAQAQAMAGQKPAQGD